MKNKMNYSFFFVLIAMFFAMPQATFAQEGDGDGEVDIENLHSDEEKMVFWFYISLRITEDRRTRQKVYNVRRLGTRVYSGTLDEYDQDLHKHLSSGHKFAIGPFYDYYEAQQALHFYNVTKKAKPLDSKIDPTKDVFYFMLVIKRMKRSKAYVIERAPGRISSGKAQDFDDFLNAVLPTRVLAVGPFWDMEEAEEAKRVYRLAGQNRGGR